MIRLWWKNDFNFIAELDSNSASKRSNEQVKHFTYLYNTLPATAKWLNTNITTFSISKHKGGASLVLSTDCRKQSKNNIYAKIKD